MKEHDRQRVLGDSCNTTAGECWEMYISVVVCFVLFYSQKSHDGYPFPDCGRLSELGNGERLSAFPAPAGKKSFMVLHLFISTCIAWVPSIDSSVTVLPQLPSSKTLKDNSSAKACLA